MRICIFYRLFGHIFFFFHEARYDEQIAITIVNYRVASKERTRGKEADVVFLRFYKVPTAHGDGDNRKARWTMCNRVASTIKSHDT